MNHQTLVVERNFNIVKIFTEAGKMLLVNIYVPPQAKIAKELVFEMFRELHMAMGKSEVPYFIVGDLNK